MAGEPRTEAGMGERARAVTLAMWVLDEAGDDPDSDMSILARQFLRSIEAVDRLTKALTVAAHSPHDQAGEPVEGFPVCSVCGAIQTDAEWTTERQPGDDEECERLGCEDKMHPVHHQAAHPRGT